MSTTKTITTDRLNGGKVVRTGSNGITRLVNAPVNNGRTPNVNIRRKLMANAANRRGVGDRRQQLVNTYLTLAYEMRPGLERKIFRKYVLLVMYSIDKIAGSTSNLEQYSKLYKDAEKLTGTVDLKIQNKCAEIISDILENISKIDSSTSKKLFLFQ